MDNKAQIQITSNLNKQMNNMLNIFEKNRNWPDIEKWIMKV
jgi:hypothetical protein